METKFNIGEMVYCIDNKTIKNGFVENIGIDSKKNISYKIEILWNSGRNTWETFHENQCFDSYEEAKTHVINILTSEFQEDMKKILAMKEE